MSKIESRIAGSSKLTDIFGYWPSFHDAEVLELHLLRGHVEPEKGIYVFPTLILKIHLWQLTKRVDSKGFLILRHHTLATLKFTDLENIQLKGFNHQNAMMELIVESRERTVGPTPHFVVKIEPAFGMGADFECLGMEVIDATPCSEDGKLISNDSSSNSS